MGAHEIRDLLGGISRQRVYQITSKSSFPKPVVELGQGKVWDGWHVRKWVTKHRPPLD